LKLYIAITLSVERTIYVADMVYQTDSNQATFLLFYACLRLGSLLYQIRGTVNSTFALCCCHHPNQLLHDTFGGDPTDDDGRLVKDEEEEPVDLEVVHIIPRSLVSSNDALMQLVLLPLPVTLFN
jgi:hypothetical protein